LDYLTKDEIEDLSIDDIKKCEEEAIKKCVASGKRCSIKDTT
jgi:hypothetical protein